MKTKLAVCSLFRDCVNDVRRTFLDRSRWTMRRSEILHICVEGDSADGTYEALKNIRGFRTIVEKIDQGSHKFGSVAEPERLKNLGQLWNHALDIAVTENAHHTIILDSDISTSPSTIPKLLARKCDVIAPLLLFENSTFFRDTWAYSQGGVDFTNRPPYHTCYNNNAIFEVDSVGVPLMSYQVLKAGARCTSMEVVGLSAAIKALGYKIFVDPQVSVYHPRHDIQIPAKYDLLCK